MCFITARSPYSSAACLRASAASMQMCTFSSGVNSVVKPSTSPTPMSSGAQATFLEKALVAMVMNRFTHA